MPKDKSQLDIYQIERETVVTEMSKSLAPVQQAQFTTLFETVTVGTPTPENITELSESIVGYIIRKQNNKPNNRKNMTDNVKKYHKLSIF